MPHAPCLRACSSGQMQRRCGEIVLSPRAAHIRHPLQHVPMSSAFLCGAQCGVGGCDKVFRNSQSLSTHITAVQHCGTKRHLAEEVPEEMSSESDDPDEEDLDLEEEPAVGFVFGDDCLDAAACVLAALDGAEHLSMSSTQRVVALLQPYTTSIIKATIKATADGLRSAAAERTPHALNQYLEDQLTQHFQAFTQLARGRSKGSALARRLARLGGVPPTPWHRRPKSKANVATTAADGAAGATTTTEDDAAHDEDQAGDENDPALEAGEEVEARLRPQHVVSVRGFGGPLMLCQE